MPRFRRFIVGPSWVVANLLAALAATGVVVTLAACGDEALFDVNGGKPVRVEIVSDTAGLSPAAGGTAIDVAVRLFDASGQPVVGWSVAWRARSASDFADAPQGRVSDDTVRTDADGIADIVWTLGTPPETYYLDVQAARIARSTGTIGEVAPVSPVVDCAADLPSPCPDLIVRVPPF